MTGMRIVSTHGDGWQVVTCGRPRGMACALCGRLRTWLWFHPDTQALACASCRWPDEAVVSR